MQLVVRRSLRPPSMALLMLSAWLVPCGSWAQDDSQAPTGASEEAQPQISQAERLRRLDRVIASDKEKLAQIKEDLAGRETLFDTLTEQIQAAEANVVEMKQRLEEQGGAQASEEAAALSAEIALVEEWIAVGKDQSEITFKSAKALQEQVQALDLQIAEDEKALADLTGPTAEELDKPDVAAETVPAEGSSTTPGLTPAQVLIPGSATVPAPTPDQPVEKAAKTTEQIEARREAEKARRGRTKGCASDAQLR